MHRRGIARTVAFAALCVATMGPVAAVAHAAAPSDRAQGDSSSVSAEDQIVLSGTASVPAGRVVGEVVVFRGRAVISGVAQGDVVVISGPAVVTGQVGGSVVALDGHVRLGSHAQIAGDVLSSEEVPVPGGAVVLGEVRGDSNLTLAGPAAALGALLGEVAVAISVLLLGLAVLLLTPRGMDRVALALRSAPVPAGGWGLVVAIVVPPAVLALLVTVVGIPLGLALLLAIGFALLLGCALTAFGVGRLFVREPRSRVGALLAGWAVLAVVGLVPVLGTISWIAASVLGTGAATVAVWRLRGGGRHRVGGAGGSQLDGPAPLG